MDPKLTITDRDIIWWKAPRNLLNPTSLSGWNRSNPAFTAMSFKEPTKKTVYPTAICTIIIIVSSISYETLPTETVSEKTQKSNGVDEKYASLDLTRSLVWNLLQPFKIFKCPEVCKWSKVWKQRWLSTKQDKGRLGRAVCCATQDRRGLLQRGCRKPPFLCKLAWWEINSE